MNVFVGLDDAAWWSFDDDKQEATAGFFVAFAPHLEIDNYAMAISLVASTRGVALLPLSAENFLPWSVISRPTIDLVVGYHKANTSPILRTFLSRIDDLTARISSKTRRMSGQIGRAHV